ncbi:MAG: hypothetical protein MRY83_02930 [Flavobacteriales bacterium]|nr:hypothetical protein [Flavobacteriales bacterium]
MRNHRIPSIFKSRQPKGFKYQPRFYNQQREELQERIDRIQSESTEEGKKAKEEIDAYKMSFDRRANRSNRRVFIIAGFIIFLVYLYFRYSPNV